MNYRVLIVDDSPLLRATARRAVLQAGVADENIREAHDGQQALEALASGPVDVVLLDVNMPVMDGGETLKRMRSHYQLQNTQVVMLTTESGRDRVVELAKYGLKDYLVKPFTRDTIVEKLNPMLQLYRGSMMPSEDDLKVIEESASNLTVLAASPSAELQDGVERALGDHAKVVRIASLQEASKFERIHLRVERIGRHDAVGVGEQPRGRRAAGAAREHGRDARARGERACAA